MPKADDAPKAATPKTVPLRYVGKKPSEVDHIYGTGIQWIKGISDVQEVPEDKAPFLLAHPDVWADARTEKQREKRPIPAVERQSLQVNDPAPHHILLPDINTMTATRDELRDYAHRHFGIELAEKATQETLRNDLERLMKIHPFTPVAFRTNDRGPFDDSVPNADGIEA
jgi:hypothetical protein